MKRTIFRASALLPAVWLVLTGCSGSSTEKGPESPGYPTGEGTGNESTKGESSAGVWSPPVQKLEFPSEPFREEQPEPGEPRPFRLPEVEQFRLKNGIQVYLVKQQDLPIVSLDLNFEGGTRNDPGGKAGMASVCMDMLTEGTRDLEKIAYREALADVASSIDAYTGSETQGVTMRSLSKHFDRTFELFMDTVREPGFRQADFDRMVKRRLDAIKQAKSSPDTLASRLAGRVLYGASHPFGSVETEDSVEALQISDCVRYHKRFLKPRGARLFVVGDMSEEKIKEAFSGAAWKGAPKRSARLQRPKPLAGKVFFANIEGAKQSVIYYLQFGPKRRAKDYFANHLMSMVLGGGFTSRINMNLREDKGYSYGAYGFFNYSRQYGTFRAGGRVKSETTFQSLKEIFGEIQALHSGDRAATEGELQREKNGAILGLPSRFATAGRSLSMYRNLVYYGLPLDYYNSYVGNVRSIDVSQVMRSAKAHLKPGEGRILVVGDAEAPLIHRGEDGEDRPLEQGGERVTLLEGLQDLAQSEDELGGSGALVILDEDGNVVETRKP